MTPHNPSLLRTLLRSTLLPSALAAILGVFIVYTLVLEEYDELQDLALSSKAHLILAVYEARQAGGSEGDLAQLLAFERETHGSDERSSFWIVEQTGTVLIRSAGAGPVPLAVPVQPGLSTVQDDRIAALRSGPLAVIVSAPMAERNEAIRDVVMGVIAGFALLGGLVALAAFRAVKRSVDVIVDLAADIATKNAHDLTPISRRNAFAEIEPAVAKIDILMARLDAALGAERAFATNAAHELRTPVAICLAQVQRLRAKIADPASIQSAAEIEQGLKRLTRLIERLLQMARAQAGLGNAAAPADVRPVISLLLREMRERSGAPPNLTVIAPQGEWISLIDPDAIGIILTNLFDNAVKHASGDGAVLVDAGTAGRVLISNDCDPLTPAELDAVQSRFFRRAPTSEGFGLGLSIVQELCNQSGSTLEILSPLPGTARGLCVVWSLPLEKAAPVRAA